MSKEKLKFFSGHAPAQAKFISSVKEPMFLNTSSRVERRSQKIISTEVLSKKGDTIR